MSKLDYSKWNNIEISDDEDDTHPNIDTPSLFRWRHQARVERMEERTKKKDELTKGMEKHQLKQAEMRQKITEAEEMNAADLAKLKLDADELEKQDKEWKEKEAALKKEEKMTPWNVDTLCKEGKSRTIINKTKDPPKRSEMSDDDKADLMHKFVLENKKDIEKFGMLRKYEASRDFLVDRRHLVCEETTNHLVLWCINLQLEEKISLMEHVSHQTIVMQFILQLADSLNIDPKDCVRPFFSRIQLADRQYSEAFNDELEAFRGRVRGRAEQRLQDAMKDAEEEARQERLGPGGLDPQEVFETLPEEMQQCFESRQVDCLQDVLQKLAPDEAQYHMKRCVDSGLWVTDAKQAAQDEAAAATDDTTDATEEPSVG